MSTKKIVILFTACVDPKGMSNTMIQDKELRLSQYRIALDFYLENCDLPILVVENTSFDFSSYYQKYIDVKRLEFLAFQGNDYDKELGKGYGEGLILKHAFENSDLIKQTDYVVKITGRLIVNNAISIINHVQYRLNKTCKSYVYGDMSLKYDYSPSQFFIAHKSFIADYFLPNISRISDKNVFYFEHLLAEQIHVWIKNGGRFGLFIYPPMIQGLSGTTGKPVENKSVLKQIGKLVFNALKLNKL